MGEGEVKKHETEYGGLLHSLYDEPERRKQPVENDSIMGWIKKLLNDRYIGKSSYYIMLSTS